MAAEDSDGAIRKKEGSLRNATVESEDHWTFNTTQPVKKAQQHNSRGDLRRSRMPSKVLGGPSCILSARVDRLGGPRTRSWIQERKMAEWSFSLTKLLQSRGTWEKTVIRGSLSSNNFSKALPPGTFCTGTQRKVCKELGGVVGGGGGCSSLESIRLT